MVVTSPNSGAVSPCPDSVLADSMLSSCECNNCLPSQVLVALNHGSGLYDEIACKDTQPNVRGKKKEFLYLHVTADFDIRRMNFRCVGRMVPRKRSIDEHLAWIQRIVHPSRLEITVAVVNVDVHTVTDHVEMPEHRDG